MMKACDTQTYGMFSNNSRKATTARATSVPVVITFHFASRTVTSQQIDISWKQPNSQFVKFIII